MSVSDETARALVQCYQRRHWLETELDEVNMIATELVEQIRAAPYVMEVARHASPDEAMTERLRVPEYVTAWRTDDYATAVLSREVDCPVGCVLISRHIHTADGEVHPVDM